MDIAPVVPPEKKPDNVEFIEHNALDGLPYKSNSFDFVYARILLSVYTRTQWTEIAVPEYARVCKSGGWVELMEFDESLKGRCENVDRLSKACKCCVVDGRHDEKHQVGLNYSYVFYFRD